MSRHIIMAQKVGGFYSIDVIKDHGNVDSNNMENCDTTLFSTKGTLSQAKESSLSVSLCGQLGVKKNFLKRACGKDWNVTDTSKLYLSGSEHTSSSSITQADFSNTHTIKEVSIGDWVHQSNESSVQSNFVQDSSNNHSSSALSKMTLCKRDFENIRLKRNDTMVDDITSSNLNKTTSVSNVPIKQEKDPFELCLTASTGPETPVKLNNKVSQWQQKDSLLNTYPAGVSVLTPQKSHSNNGSIVRALRSLTPITKRLQSSCYSEGKKSDHPIASLNKGFSAKRRIFSHNDKENRPPNQEKYNTMSSVQLKPITSSPSRKLNTLSPRSKTKTEIPSMHNLDSSTNPSKEKQLSEQNTDIFTSLIPVSSSCPTVTESIKSDEARLSLSDRKSNQVCTDLHHTIVSSSNPLHSSHTGDSKSKANCVTTPAYKQSVVTIKQTDTNTRLSVHLCPNSVSDKSKAVIVVPAAIKQCIHQNHEQTVEKNGHHDDRNNSNCLLNDVSDASSASDSAIIPASVEAVESSNSSHQDSGFSETVSVAVSQEVPEGSQKPSKMAHFPYPPVFPSTPITPHSFPHIFASPPGTLPPGNLPPGNLPPGNLPPGTLLPGNLPPGNLLPGNLLPGNLPPENLPPGTLLPGNLPPGNLLPGNLPPGNLPPGTLLPGNLPPGNLLPGNLLPGNLPSAAIRHLSNVTPHVSDPMRTPLTVTTAAADPIVHAHAMSAILNQSQVPVYSAASTSHPYHLSPYLTSMLRPLHASTPSTSVDVKLEINPWQENTQPQPSASHIISQQMAAARHDHLGLHMIPSSQPMNLIPPSMFSYNFFPPRQQILTPFGPTPRPQHDASEEQNLPLDLSGIRPKMEVNDGARENPCRKTLFPPSQSNGMTTLPPSQLTRLGPDGFNSSGDSAYKSDEAERHSPESLGSSDQSSTAAAAAALDIIKRERENERNPFGIHKILGVQLSPARVAETQNQAGPSNYLQLEPRPVSRPVKRRLPSSDEFEETDESEPAAKKKKSRDKPPEWGVEMPIERVYFEECEERLRFCDENLLYEKPEMPTNFQEQEELRCALLRLFQRSNLPPVPQKLKENLIALRFYPHMKTIFQASLHVDTAKLNLSPGGLAFENFRIEESNLVIDQMLRKEGDLYHCLGRKCIDPIDAVCTFTAKTLGKMRRHVKNHLPDKKWVCLFCRSQMTDQTDMSRHGTTHTRLRPFFCDPCGKSYSQKVTLVSHLKSTHLIAMREENTKLRYTCRPCGVHFKTYQRRECIDHLHTYHFTTLYSAFKKKNRFPFDVQEA